MYTETRENFSIRTVILQFLFIALLVFILIWLFPMKKDLNKAISSIKSSNSDSQELSILYDRIFNENLLNMKESAKDYFTLARLPKKVGESEKITLQEMLDKKIILPFTDKNGKQCDTKASYVLVTKYDEEFVMKVNLKCGKEENYLLVNMGCYDYCSQTICEKKNTTTKVYKAAKKTTPVKKVTTSKTEIKVENVINNTIINNIVVPSTPVVPDAPEYKYLYEYKKVTDGTSSYTGWSNWSTDAVSPSANVEVKQRTDKVRKLVAYKKITSDDLSKPIYETKQVPIASKAITSCASYNVTSTITGYDYQYVGTFKYTVAPQETSTYTYKKVGDYSWYCDGNCTAGTVMVYEKYQKVPQTSTSYSCAKYDTETSVILGNRTVITGYEKKVTTEPVYDYYNKTYYSYRTKVTTPGQVLLKWSTYNDTTLLNDGYSYTGNTKTELVK